MNNEISPEEIAGYIVAACEVSEVHVSDTELKLMRMISEALQSKRDAFTALEKKCERLVSALERIGISNDVEVLYMSDYEEIALEALREFRGDG